MGIESKLFYGGKDIENLSLPEIKSELEVLNRRFKELDENPFSAMGSKIEFDQTQKTPEGALLDKPIISSALNLRVAELKIERMHDVINKIKALKLKESQLQPK